MRYPLAATSAALALATPLTAQTSIGARAGMTLSTFSVSDETIDRIEQSSLAATQFGVTAKFMGERARLLLSATHTRRGAVTSFSVRNSRTIWIIWRSALWERSRSVRDRTSSRDLPWA